MAPKTSVTGLHHVTVIAGDPQTTVDFYVRTMGLRLVKKSVNQDVPDTYHLFFADGEGNAGTDLTFFPWPDMGPGRNGVGLTVEVSLAIPAGSLAFWVDRFGAHGVAAKQVVRFGESSLELRDPHGLALVLSETSDERDFAAWERSPINVEHQIRGLHSVRMLERNLATTERFLIEGLGFAPVGEEAGWRRFALGAGKSGTTLDVREAPAETRGLWGQGVVHHIAWRVPDDQAHLEVRDRVAMAGGRPTDVIDRFWFRSVYFKEPGGSLFEVATDGPGFTADEPVEALGTRLVLPPWLEPRRAEIEAALPPISAPAPSEPTTRRSEA